VRLSCNRCLRFFQERPAFERGAVVPDAPKIEKHTRVSVWSAGSTDQILYNYLLLKIKPL
jgi:hypothetical protein